MNEVQVKSIVHDVTIPGYEIIVAEFWDSHRMFIQIMQEVDGKVQKGRRWALSEHMIIEEILGTIFLALKVFQEHELRESLLYRGKQIFVPHPSLDGMIQASLDQAFRKGDFDAKNGG